MSHTIFISFSSENQLQAERVCNYLEQNGVKCWISSRDCRDSHMTAIPDAIEACKYLVLIASPQSAESPWVPDEINLAKTKKKILVPFDIVKFEYPKEWWMLGTSQRINAYSDFDNALMQLLERVGGQVKASNQGTTKKSETKSFPSCQDNVTLEGVDEVVKRIIALECGESLQSIKGYNNITALGAGVEAVAVRLSNQFGISIPRDYIKGMYTVDDAIRIVRQFINAVEVRKNDNVPPSAYVKNVDSIECEMEVLNVISYIADSSSLVECLIREGNVAEGDFIKIYFQYGKVISIYPRDFSRPNFVKMVVSIPERYISRGDVLRKIQINEIPYSKRDRLL